MTYKQKGDNVTLEMTRDDYQVLMFLLGIATGYGSTCNKIIAYKFVNALNAMNPNFTPFEIPKTRSAS